LTPDERALAQSKLDTLKRAHDFEVLLQTPGWKHIFALHTEWVESARKTLRAVDTSMTAQAIDALQRWQIAENLLELEANFINDTLAQADEIKGNVTLPDALLMEQLRNEHESTEQRTDPAGY